MDVPNTFNSIVYATVQTTTIDDLYANWLYLKTHASVHPLLLRAVEYAIIYQQPAPNSTVVYTDDLAPVEWVTNSMILGYIFSGEMDELR